MSVGSGSDDFAWPYSVVTDVQQVIENEIWTIMLFFPTTSSTQIFYVLESTCEVVGHATPATSATSSVVTPLRADWSDYIEQRTSGSQAFGSSSLMDHVKWANYEEYDRGISRLWMKRSALEGELGAAKRAVAERYILACVVGNRSVHRVYSKKF